MNIEILKKEEMETVKALADMTVKISEARETMSQLEITKDQFIALRDKQAVEQIQEVFDRSHDLLESIKNNNEEVHALHNTVSEYKAFLEEGYESFKKLLEEFRERDELWDLLVEKRHEEFKKLEQAAEKDRKEIEDSKRRIEEDREEVRKAKIKIADDRETIKRALERLKNNKR